MYKKYPHALYRLSQSKHPVKNGDANYSFREIQDAADPKAPSKASLRNRYVFAYTSCYDQNQVAQN